MRALVYTGARTLAFREVDEPVPGDEDALVQVERVGVCGSDMHAWAGHDERRPAPLILGHEASGTTAAGERVAVNPLVVCGQCERCLEGRENLCATRQIISMPPREGAFAERLVIPRRNLVLVPAWVASDKASLVEPLACGWHAVRLAEGMLSRPLDMARCLVIGGGAIGLGAALALAARGARGVRIAEPAAARRAVVARAGDFDVFDPADDVHAGGADLVIDGVGFEATRSMACHAVRPGGVIGHIGLGSAAGGLDVRRMTLQEIAFFGAYTYTMADFRETAAAIFDGRLGALDWIETRPLSDGARAFDDLAAGRVAAPKLILVP